MDIKQEIQFLKFCFQRRKDTRFVKNVMTIGDDFSLVNLIKMGSEKQGAPLYYIAPDATGSGFFADHNRLLSYLYYADYFGLCPVVEYSKGYSYAEKEPVNGTCNPFEYYFRQPGGVSLQTLSDANMVIKCRKENAALAGKLNDTGKGYDFSEEYLNELGRISAKYIRLNDIVEPWMQDQITKCLGEKKTLGVHVRGTDFKRNYKGHPIKISTEEYLAAAKKIFGDTSYEQVFLATDDVEALELFRKEFGDKLCCYADVVRSSGDETVMKSTAERKNHHYLLGLEVLRDVCTLAVCDSLVAGLSQVSFAARIWKKSMSGEYERISVLDKGMNLSGDICKS